MKRLILLMLFAAPALAGTGTATVKFVPATAYSDGTPIGTISGQPVTCTFQATGSSTKAPCAGQTPLEFPGTVSTGAVTFTYPAQGGEACFSVSTRVGVAVSDPVGGSGAACVKFGALKPNGPSNVVVTVTVAVNP